MDDDEVEVFPVPFESVFRIYAIAAWISVVLCSKWTKSEYEYEYSRQSGSPSIFLHLRLVLSYLSTSFPVSSSPDNIEVIVHPFDTC